MTRNRFLLVGSLLFILLSGCSMFFYTGGYPTDLTARYSLAHNFISDLGISQGYNHTPIHTSNVFFVLALIVASSTVGYFFFTVSGLPKKLQITQKLLGTIAALATLGVALTPSDLYLWPHRISMLLVFLATFLGFVLLSRHHTHNTAATVLATTMGLYILYLLFGPLPEVSPLSREVHAVLQKLIIYGMFVYIAIPKRPETIHA
jgi:hypothetical membrane protein